ncbi:hypothetical protein [Natronosalvus halobius]|uniref:hypothetical protein n=1 Tax=Natronosalvus halobius TaxID=2953746 RepID=UPI0020A13D5F|nr:hypothetical protein [Natronosalvus halobius]USZ70579.1 hypothetical protein NGM15_10715 [Natronosalvus halobius]
MYLGETVTTVGFWVGTLLPFVYVPVFLTGLNSTTRLGIFFALVAFNVLALVVGHDYSGSQPQ